MKRCPDCRRLVLVAQSERGELLLDHEPAPDGHVIFQTAVTEDGQALGARRARFLADGEMPRPGTTRWVWHGFSCSARKRPLSATDEQRELRLPYKESA